MPDLLFDVPDDLEELLNSRAKRNGRTPEDEHRMILMVALGQRSRDADLSKSAE